MINVFCDKCGKPVDYEVNGINVDFNHYGVVKFMSNTKDEHFELCARCAKDVVDFIKGEIKTDAESEGE